MGNNASTPSSAHPSPHPSTRSSRSPRTRNISLPASHDSSIPLSRASSTSSSATDPAHRRRKKSIELSDVVDPSLRFSHAATRQGSASSAGSSISASTAGGRNALSRAASGGRRIGSDRLPVLADDERDREDGEDDDDASGMDDGEVGTLRGALQGKAEHVVYGPRRQDDGTGLASALALTKGPIVALPTVGATTARSDATAQGELRGARVGGKGAVEMAKSGSSGLSPIGEVQRDAEAKAESESPAAAVGPPKLSMPLLDPDDTMHPAFKDSPRLTAAVLMSTDSMPVLSSPHTEDLPADSPFHPSSSHPPSSTGASTPVVSSVPQVASDSTVQTSPTTPTGSRAIISPQTSFSSAGASITAPTSPSSADYPTVARTSDLLPPHTSAPTPPSAAPTDTVLAPIVPASVLPIAPESIPSGTSVIASPTQSRGTTPTGALPSPAVLLPPTLFNAPVAAIPIPLLSVPSQTIAQNLIAAAVDLGAGNEGVPTLIKWKNEDGQEPEDSEKGGKAKGPKEVYVTGTFAKGWKTKIELRKTDPSDFSALISLPPGPHRLKFIVDNEWKASKHLPVATDADGNLINYLQVNPVDSKIPPTLWTTPAPSSAGAHPDAASPSSSTGGPGAKAPQPPQGAGANGAGGVTGWPGLFGHADDEDPSGGVGGGYYDEEDSAIWTQSIPAALEEWGEWEAQRDQIELDWLAANPNPTQDTPGPVYPPQPASAGVPPPTLPAQLEKGPLNHAAYVTQGSGDDNSILPKPDHSVINHLAASPIKGGFLSVGVTTRYKRKFVTIVYYKALATH
ncbi:hypothetical protein JCM1841_003282 [Sporobolomyces salmonicolor]